MAQTRLMDGFPDSKQGELITDTTQVLYKSLKQNVTLRHKSNR